MHSKGPDIIDSHLNALNGICDTLDFLASPNLEEKMICSLDCCPFDSVYAIRVLITCADETQFIIGDEGLQLLRQLEEMLSDACYYDDEKGFSTTQRWLDFIDFVNTLNIRLKDIITKYNAANAKLT